MVLLIKVANYQQCSIFVEEEMATHSSVLAWRIPGTAGPGELPMGSHRVGYNLVTKSPQPEIMLIAAK